MLAIKNDKTKYAKLTILSLNNGKSRFFSFNICGRMIVITLFEGNLAEHINCENLSSCCHNVPC